MHRVRLSSKGRIVTPAEVRSRLGLKRGSLLTVRLEGKRVVIEPLEEPPQEVFIEAGGRNCRQGFSGGKGLLGQS
jgi:AbrB family looped-hinge helix DNA binding protein